jgi:hypothetical protein
MVRYTIDTFTSGSIAGSGSGTVNHTLSFNAINVYKLKVVPSSAGAGGTTQIEIYKKDTFLAADLVYRSGEFTGTLIDTGEDSGSAITEREEGFVLPYEDSDTSFELHIKIINNDASARTYSFTVVYEESVSLFTARTLGTPALYTDLTDLDYWLPARAPTELITTTDNGDGTLTISPNGSNPTATYLNLEFASYVMSRFLIFPDSDGLVQVRAKFSGCHLWGSDYANRVTSALIGLHWNLGGQNDFQTFGFRNSASADNTLLARLYNDDNQGATAFGEDYFNLGVIGPGTFYGELILAMGHCRTPTNNYYRFGVDQPACGYSLNGGAWTYFTAASTNEPPYCTSYPGYMFGATICCGLFCDYYTRAENTITIEEIEVIKGFTANVT